ncbi:AAA family ATPase [Phyllobacterium sp. YR531]|uniref:AAA family ATPase n=1 Tax=Phyllobacterium sp. YR531 TaxID=1144343 RepID=UPI00026FA9D4|nr:AAA family ATPase [Phyllobacterium sp. YR531]EJN04186.1 Chromatin associated protein KTI12 [Phyllobacterium sp. YR531]
MLIIMSGLPGTGKSTIARDLARRLNGFHLRADTIAQSLISAGVVIEDNNPTSYVVGHAIAEENLRLGAVVIADYVNSTEESRRAWRDVASRAEVSFEEVEVTCSDVFEHQRRVENRVSDIPGMELPTWQQVVNRTFEKSKTGSTIIDTAAANIEETLDALVVPIKTSLRKDI